MRETMLVRRGLVLVLGLGLVSLWARPIGAQQPAAEARLLRDLKYLAGDECEGRGIQTKGINLAAEYIAREFQKAGLKPAGPDGTYFQRFSLITDIEEGNNTRLVLKGPLGQNITLVLNDHFRILPQGSAGKAEASVVFAGYGITAPELNYDDYAGLDVDGKVVIIEEGTPRRGHPFADVFAADLSKGHHTFSSKLDNALRHKAVGVLLINNLFQETYFHESFAPIRYPLRDGDVLPLPAVQVRRVWVDQMLGSSGIHLADIERAIDATLKPHSRPIAGWTCQLETDFSPNKLPVKNIVGVLEGAGPLARETVVIGAHYDHVGMGMPISFGGTSGPSMPGGVGFPLAETVKSTIHHGADDNASGTAAIVEIARRFGLQRNRQGRRLVFMAFTAEETGLVGSEHYCREPIFPLKDTVAMINLDMVGRLQEDKLSVGGLGTAKNFHTLIDEINQKQKRPLHLVKDDSGIAPTDTTPFFKQNVPVFWFFTGFHQQYHRPTDRVETINVPGLRQVAELVGDLVADLKTSPRRPQFVKTTAPFDREKLLWAEAPCIGVLPVYGDAKEGVLVEGVIEETPAAKARLKKGDRIVALAGQPVKDLGSYLAITRNLKPEQKLEASVLRNGRKEKIPVQLAKIPPYATLGIWPDFSDDVGGVLLASVREKTPAAKAGLQSGDRIVSINDRTMSTALHYLLVMLFIQPDSKLDVTVLRQGELMKFRVVLQP